MKKIKGQMIDLFCTGQGHFFTMLINAVVGCKTTMQLVLVAQMAPIELKPQLEKILSENVV
jgi:hypothetical protein